MDEKVKKAQEELVRVRKARAEVQNMIKSVEQTRWIRFVVYGFLSIFTTVLIIWYLIHTLLTG